MSHVVMMNLSTRTAVVKTASGLVEVPIVYMIDADNVLTDDPLQCVAFVCGSEKTKWFTAEVSHFRPQRTQ